jgi:hypothetical protein
MSVKMTDCHGGGITIDVKDIPQGCMGWTTLCRHGILPPNTFGVMSCLAALKSASSLSIIIPEDARNTPLYTAVEVFTSPEWCYLLQGPEDLASLAVPPLCPASRQGRHRFVIGFHYDVPEIEEGCHRTTRTSHCPV